MAAEEVFVSQAVVDFTVGPTVLSDGFAQVAELVDALDSGSSTGNSVEVRVLSRAQGESVKADSPFLFYRPNNCLPLPAGERVGERADAP